MVSTVVVAVGLSLAPLPDALRPWPGLRDKPGETTLATLWPSRSSRPTRLPTPGAVQDGEPGATLPTEEDTEPPPPPPPPPPPRVVNAREVFVPRLSPDEVKRGQRFEAQVRTVSARHVDVEDPCVERGANDACTRTALSPFFAALKQMHEGRTAGPVHVVALGTSLIVSDHITDVLRARLQARHGSAGKGFFFVDRPMRGAGRTVRNGTATEGWNIIHATDDPVPPYMGMSGVAFIAPSGSKESTTYELADSNRVDLFLVDQPGGGEVEVYADNALLDRVPTASDSTQVNVSRVDVPKGKKRVVVRPKGGPVRLDGVAVESDAPGLVFDTLGLPGATPTVLLKEDPTIFAEQLQARDPKLMILILGGNDAFDIAVGRYTPEQGKQRFRAFLERVRSAVPGSACLLAAPPDAGTWRMDKTIAVRAETKAVAAYMHELAFASGCAFWDMQAAMGGEGAVTRWWDAGLMNQDLVHPSAQGGDVMGYLFDEAVERARQHSPVTLAKLKPRRGPGDRRTLRPRHGGRRLALATRGLVRAVLAQSGEDAGAARKRRTPEGALGGDDAGTPKKRRTETPESSLEDGGAPRKRHPGTADPALSTDDAGTPKRRRTETPESSLEDGGAPRKRHPGTADPALSTDDAGTTKKRRTETPEAGLEDGGAPRKRHTGTADPALTADDAGTPKKRRTETADSALEDGGAPHKRHPGTAAPALTADDAGTPKKRRTEAPGSSLEDGGAPRKRDSGTADPALSAEDAGTPKKRRTEAPGSSLEDGGAPRKRDSGTADPALSAEDAGTPKKRRTETPEAALEDGGAPRKRDSGTADPALSAEDAGTPKKRRTETPEAALEDGGAPRKRNSGTADLSLGPDDGGTAKQRGSATASDDAGTQRRSRSADAGDERAADAGTARRVPATDGGDGFATGRSRVPDAGAEDAGTPRRRPALDGGVEALRPTPEDGGAPRRRALDAGPDDAGRDGARSRDELGLRVGDRAGDLGLSWGRRDGGNGHLGAEGEDEEDAGLMICLGDAGEELWCHLDLELPPLTEEDALDGGPRPTVVAARHVFGDGGMSTCTAGASIGPTEMSQPQACLSNAEALGPFFEWLHSLERTHRGRVAIAQLGASHTAAHFFTDSVREQLATRFGSAGRGYVSAGKPSDRLTRGGISRFLTSGWTVQDAVHTKTVNEAWGLSGTRAIGRPGADFTIDFDERHGTADDVARVQVSFLESPDAGAVEVLVGGQVVLHASPPDAGPARVRVVEIAVPGKHHEVTVSPLGPHSTTIFGVSHERMAPGIIYDALGLPGATSMVVAGFDQRALAEQLRAREVDLFVLFYGTNEASLPHARVEGEMRAAYRTLFATLHEASPQAVCLVLAPTDRMSKKRAGWRPAESMDLVTQEMEDIARENGCAFWATRAVMGGPGSMERWRRANPTLANKDHVHLSALGYRHLADMFVSDLMSAYEAWRAAR